MKAVILAGGLGTRISEETHLKPKPMIEIGSKPILWHIMKLYSFYDVNEFIICCGYRGYVVKEYFANYFLHMSDVTFDMASNKIEIHSHRAEPWKVTLVDTGEHTATGGRLKRVKSYLEDDLFCFTYGDGLSNINIRDELDFHIKQGKLATVAAVQPQGRFGSLKIRHKKVVGFEEKPKGDGAKINGGFFILDPKCIDLIENDNCSWEKDIVNKLCELNELAAYEHNDFWYAMDTLRDKAYLEELWIKGAPWKVWNDEHK